MFKVTSLMRSVFIVNAPLPSSARVVTDATVRLGEGNFGDGYGFGSLMSFTFLSGVSVNI